jgi:hypothetical protein
MVNYYAIHNGEKVVLNNSTSYTGGSWWYELLPSSLFTALAACTSIVTITTGPILKIILLNMARQWYDVVVAAGGANAISATANPTAFVTARSPPAVG